ncbi:hypothetical protein BDW22DRAFT_974584 [Trametopsis cervina]|nr:hypothetical protein BDW22DRAFT_974584 [Trametopsis cervina]
MAQHTMHSKDSATRITLPSINDLLPEELLRLPKRPIYNAAYPGRYAEQYVNRGIRALDVPQTASPLHTASQTSPGYRSSQSDSPSTSPFTPSHPLSDPYDPIYAPDLQDRSFQRRAVREDEKKHACKVCGKAFNRPSSLEIHMNIHLGRKPFKCPFPGCGREFNVNSNMRRHLRNHTSPSRPPITSIPYTYPLTSAPRPLPTGGHHVSMGTRHTPVTGLRSRASTFSVYNSSQYTDSEDDDELQQRPTSATSTTSFDIDAELQETSARVESLRLRSHSSPGMRPSANPHAAPAHAMSSVCTIPGCRCTPGRGSTPRY